MTLLMKILVYSHFNMYIESFKFEKTEVTDSVIISFGTFNGIDEIHAVDIKLFDEIPEEIGRHDGHIVSLEDDTEG